MDESVALDATKQRDFIKSVRSIKKIIKKKDQKSKEAKTPVIQEDKIEKVEKKKKRANRGLVYLSHIPHGFYEQQMTEYFKQFGVVTNARVIRSKRTGNSKGFAFVEFKEPSVAQIVAETMNNYLMGKRLIKAVYIPPHKQRKNALRKKWDFQNNPARAQRLKIKKIYNANKSEDEELKIAKKLLSTLLKTKKKLGTLGIDYDFFKPSDVPEVLKDRVESTSLNKTEFTSAEEIKSEEKKSKLENIKQETDKDDKSDVKGKIKQKEQKVAKQKQISNKEVNKLEPRKENLKKSDKKKLKGIVPEKHTKADKEMPQNFISIKETDDSDSSIDFDSDEFEKMIEDDDDESVSDSEMSKSEDEKDESKVVKVSKVVGKGTKKKIGLLGKVNLSTKVQNKHVKATIESVKSHPKKRRHISSEPVQQKKAKFEKKVKNPAKKFNKKKK